jgi:hypothetical protein
MANKYEVDYTGDGQMVQPMVNVIVTRDGVELQMSARRPF